MGNIHYRVTNSTFGDSIMSRIHGGENFSDYDEKNRAGDFPVGEFKEDYFKYFDQLPELDSDSDDEDKVDLRKKVKGEEDFPVPNIRNDEDEGRGNPVPTA
ncbi:hypothetical protein RIF29_41165 [Crotalaria pallida]|uniref:Uncharacterized protein n=1 Tax=Crotalaria pallida TaxID=3830 RepID=A0AAN9HSE0_CROPI